MEKTDKQIEWQETQKIVLSKILALLAEYERDSIDYELLHNSIRDAYKEIPMPKQAED